MNWYIAPIITDCPEHGGTHPAGAGPVCRGLIKGMVVHCYSGSDCLVGTPNPMSVAGWTAKSLGEAQDHFTTFYGRSPTAQEVF